MDITGKHIVITGATAGIGQSSAHTLAQQGADLTLLCRNLEKGAAVAADIIAAGGSEPKLIEMDMASLASVRSAAQAVLAPGRPVDILLNNAGVVNTARKLTVDGFEETLAVNHFAPFLLTGLLLPNMLEVPGARIVNVASAAHEFVRNMGFDDMQAEQGFKTFREYGRSKLANILFTRSLATRLEGESITVNCLHPGAVATSLGAQNKGLVARLLPALLRPFFRTADKGAQTSIYLCTSDEVANCKQKQPRPRARDDDAAQRLWEYTEETIGFEYP